MKSTERGKKKKGTKDLTIETNQKHQLRFKQAAPDYNDNVQQVQSRKSLQHDGRDPRLCLVHIEFPNHIQLVCF